MRIHSPAVRSVSSGGAVIASGILANFVNWTPARQIALWVVFGVSVFAFLLSFDQVRRFFPLRIKWVGFLGYDRREAALREIARRSHIRNELRDFWSVLVRSGEDMKPSQLRLIADAAGALLADAGYQSDAARLAVHLNDDATTQSVQDRKNELGNELLKMIISGEYE